jgi:hypothetical protein
LTPIAISGSSLRTEIITGACDIKLEIETAEDEILKASFHGQCRKYAVSRNRECGATTQSGAEIVNAGATTKGGGGNGGCGGRNIKSSGRQHMEPEGAAMLEFPECGVGGDHFVFNHLKLIYDLPRPIPRFQFRTLIGFIQIATCIRMQILLFPVRHGKSLQKIRANYVLNCYLREEPEWVREF